MPPRRPGSRPIEVAAGCGMAARAHDKVIGAQFLGVLDQDGCRVRPLQDGEGQPVIAAVEALRPCLQSDQPGDVQVVPVVGRRRIDADPGGLDDVDAGDRASGWVTSMRFTDSRRCRAIASWSGARSTATIRIGAVPIWSPILRRRRKSAEAAHPAPAPEHRGPSVRGRPAAAFGQRHMGGVGQIDSASAPPTGSVAPDRPPEPSG